MTAARRRNEFEQTRYAWLAWHIAALSRIEKLPTLRKLLKDLDGKPQSQEEMNAALYQLFLATGGTVAQWEEAEARRKANGPS